MDIAEVEGDTTQMVAPAVGEQGDNKVPSKGADNPGRRETMGLQVINQPGTSTQGDINVLSTIDEAATKLYNAKTSLTKTIV
ncbi:hypothetical protein KSP40_PGU006043 [Platanthera guangdongensis]|uniref:Uncharacterized protein n=1 Tax=Platanthera guangdongensis TaxID=2320717 RepID=A0ABR2MSZ2_9ASPA